MKSWALAACGGADDVGLGEGVASVGDVVADGRVEQERLLRHHAEEPAIRLLVEPAHVAAVDGDAAAHGIVEAQDAGRRGSTCPRRSGPPAPPSRPSRSRRRRRRARARRRSRTTRPRPASRSRSSVDALGAVLHLGRHGEQLAEARRRGQRHLHLRVGAREQRDLRPRAPGRRRGTGRRRAPTCARRSAPRRRGAACPPPAGSSRRRGRAPRRACTRRTSR